MKTAVLTDTQNTIFCRIVYKKICGRINLDLLNRYYSLLLNPSILGGNSAKSEGDGFSYWAAEPLEVFEFKTGEKNPFEKLNRVLNKYRIEERAGYDLPDGIFKGGWIGFFGYELARFIEKLPDKAIDDLKMPLIRLCFYDRFIAYDHTKKETWLIALEMEGENEDVDAKIAGLERILNESQEQSIEEPKNVRSIESGFSGIRSNMDKDYYLRSVEKIKKYIFDGEVYQVNFSQRFEYDFAARPIELFQWQNEFNPCSYSAFIASDESAKKTADKFAIVSSSPELFLKIKDGIISTKPIKGTRPRVNDEADNKKVNERNYKELLDSAKEQAELNMIIDLERNDLARICVPGSRKVVLPRTIEAYPTVFHAVATVAGKLREGANFCDCLKAMFPGGSITGAPKVAAMKIIDGLEPTQRGVYTGSIGYIGVDGNVCLNIAIRTVIIKNKIAYVQTGGGIVADSKPLDEWEETLVKAIALVEGIRSIERQNKILKIKNQNDNAKFKIAISKNRHI
jgi:para-aminobenzoate synthetase component 1